ncbi:MAG: type II toxin-antitoxin system RelE/ParE family toxin [Armatimonadetes bacterium]|nr:type II toxin-antitoxin system RelE/ParE family toxin [Armatimonadota bacterium]
MAPYELRVKPSVSRDLKGVPRTDLLRLLARMEALRDDPRPPACEKLATAERYRVRQGDYRVRYEVADESRTVTVVKVGHRRDVYRGR